MSRFEDGEDSTVPDTMNTSESDEGNSLANSTKEEHRRPKFFIPGINGTARCLSGRPDLVGGRIFIPSSTISELATEAKRSTSGVVVGTPSSRTRKTSSKKKGGKKKKKKSSSTHRPSCKEQDLHEMLRLDESSQRRCYDDSDVNNFATAQNLHDALLQTIVKDRQKQFKELEKASRLPEVSENDSEKVLRQTTSDRLRDGKISATGSLLGAMLGKNVPRRSYDDQDVESLSLTQNLHDSILMSIMKDQTATPSLPTSSVGSSRCDDEASIVQDVGSQSESVYASLSPRHDFSKRRSDGSQSSLGSIDKLDYLLPSQHNPAARRYSSFSEIAVKTDPDRLLDRLHLSAPLNAPKKSRKKKIKIGDLPPPPPLAATGRKGDEKRKKQKSSRRIQQNTESGDSPKKSTSSRRKKEPGSTTKKNKKLSDTSEGKKTKTKKFSR